MGAFQESAFQSSAFQVGGSAPQVEQAAPLLGGAAHRVIRERRLSDKDVLELLLFLSITQT